MKKWQYVMVTSMATSALLLGACGGEQSNNNSSSETSSNAAEQLQGSISGDGSSTVAPIVEGIVEEYAATQRNVQVAVGVSGTGGGFEKFINGEIDFSNASRPIKDEEAAKLKEKGIDYTQFEIAYDGISIVVHKDNDWLQDVTTKELEEIWVDNGQKKKWSDIRKGWPDEYIKFYSPGTDSGTYDYFVNDVLEEQQLDKSATLSEDDNVLVKGVEADKYAIGYFGFAYYEANKERLKAVKVNGVEPTHDTIQSGDYTPLSRPLYMYANNESLKEPAMYDFMQYTLEHAGDLAESVGYVRSPEGVYEEDMKKLEAFKPE
ncbi:PstS family phosphate ABC transporter substrate-binding protein [Kurthia massiliensis]|uniref:PstS family phosphate ABC transporter substrate-binding protein n=1 Tax=Kurthia massiliensis TaxID=1033739 RepID=UPI0002897EB8|nr:PstS family phosphate ABC transporter substrate-binding protein [Kurthia massiliensis]